MNRIFVLIIYLSVSMFITDRVLSGELTTSEIHHYVNCPDPAETPCVMKRPFNSMDYTLITKDVSISEGNGVWIVTLAKTPNKTTKKQIIRVMDFFGELHVIDVTVIGPTKSENSAKPQKSNAKAAVQEKISEPSSKGQSEKPISLEKFISK
jgi:hypothetical protein